MEISTLKVCELLGRRPKTQEEKKHLKCAFVALDLVKKLQSLHGGHHVQLK